MLPREICPTCALNDRGAPRVETCAVIGQKSAEAIVSESRIGGLEDARVNYETRQLDFEKGRTYSGGPTREPILHPNHRAVL